MESSIKVYYTCHKCQNKASKNIIESELNSKGLTCDRCQSDFTEVEKRSESPKDVQSSNPYLAF